MILRRAKLEDFEIFKRLREDKENLYQFLYINSNKEESTTVSENQWIFDDSIFESYNNYTIEQFQKELESSTLLYMIQDSSEVIGYISLFYCSNNKYKIAEWAMFNPEDDNKKMEVLNCLRKLKLPRLRSFSICTINNDVAMFLIKNGFYSSGYAFLELKI